MAALQVLNGTLVPAPAAATLLSAFQGSAIGASFGPAGFLISYLAGSSSGSLLSTSLCSGARPEAVMASISELAKYCRDNNNCQNKLDQAVRVQVKKLLSPNAYQRCSGTNFISITQGRFPSKNAKNLLVSQFKSNQELVDAVAASSYIPLWSGNVGKREWTAQFKGESAYDGFFSNSQPCAPGVSYCIKVNSKSPPWTRQRMNDMLQVIGRSAVLGGTKRKVKLMTAEDAGLQKRPAASFLSVQSPNITAFKQAAQHDIDISPGIFTSTGVALNSWSDMLVKPGDEELNQHLYQLGRTDARAWAKATGLATATAAKMQSQRFSAPTYWMTNPRVQPTSFFGWYDRKAG
eukprot:gene8759-8938_t